MSNMISMCRKVNKQRKTEKKWQCGKFKFSKLKFIKWTQLKGQDDLMSIIIKNMKICLGCLWRPVRKHWSADSYKRNINENIRAVNYKHQNNMLYTS